MGWFSRTFGSGQGDWTLLDHLPLNRDPHASAPREREPGPTDGLSHEEKLRRASARLGRPFKCSADGLPRVIIRDGVDVPPDANVTSLASARKAKS